MRLVQIQHPREGRKVAVVEDTQLRLVRDYPTLYACAMAALESNIRLEEFLSSRLSDATEDYECLYSGDSEWRLLPPFDHPTEAARCLVTGTGLTHSKGAANRDAMHKAERRRQCCTDYSRSTPDLAHSAGRKWRRRRNEWRGSGSQYPAVLRSTLSVAAAG